MSPDRWRLAFMLKTIDILLGVTVVMLIVSLCVTVLTQAVTKIRETGGKKLLEGLTDLLQQIDPGLQKEMAGKIATALLRHPMISDGAARLGTTIHREEFTGLLLEIGSGAVPKELETLVDGDVKAAVTKILRDHGIDKPDEVLANVRSVALHLERLNPELANNVRYSQALLQEVRDQLLGKVHAWFDPMIDRVSARFTFNAHQVTIVCSILVAFALQLDVVGLVNRLSVDPALRQSLVEQAMTLADDKTQGSETDQMTRLEKLTGQSREQLQDLVQIGVVTLPGKDWVSNWGLCVTKQKPGQPECRARVNLVGVILSALLLSLGAPFWYNALKNLVRLRSVVAGKDDEQRQARQSSQSTDGAGSTAGASSAPSGTAPPRAATGERGVLG
jgi:hypothetical protein